GKEAWGMSRDYLSARLSSTDTKKAAWNALHVMGKILTRQVQEAERHNIGAAEQSDCRLPRPRGGIRWIDYWRRSELHFNAGPESMRGRRQRRDVLHLFQHQ